MTAVAPDPVLILEIRETHRQRQDLLRAELALNNRIEAVYRRLTGLKAEERARLRKQGSTGQGRNSAGPQGTAALPDDERGDGPIASATPGGLAVPAPHGSTGQPHFCGATLETRGLPDDEREGDRPVHATRASAVPLAPISSASVTEKGAA